MVQIIGSITVLGCTLLGFILGGGNVLLLWHPTEILIILGGALGAFFISSPVKVVKLAFSNALSLPKGPRYRREDYIDLLSLLYDVLNKMRKEGVMGIERDIEDPANSQLFQKYRAS
jgi:chemotaxis protein MotA